MAVERSHGVLCNVDVHAKDKGACLNLLVGTAPAPARLGGGGLLEG